MLWNASSCVVESFFKFIVAGKGDIVAVDDNTLKRKAMDVARVLIKTRIHDVINYIGWVDFNGPIQSFFKNKLWHIR